MPDEVTLSYRLCGTREEFWKMVAFIVEIKLSV